MNRRGWAWSEADDATLRRMILDGASARQIGAAVGRSRNAAIGRGFRLGLQFKGHAHGYTPYSVRARVETRMSKSHPAQNAVAVARKRALQAHPHSWSPNEVVTPLKRAVAVAEARARNAGNEADETSLTALPFGERKLSQCSWIVSGSGADSMQCAGPIVAGSFCARHAAVAFNPGASRSDPKDLAKMAKRYA